MALIKCSECGREISDKAISCPGCGCPVEQQLIIPNISYTDRNKNEILIYNGIAEYRHKNKMLRQCPLSELTVLYFCKRNAFGVGMLYVIFPGMDRAIGYSAKNEDCDKLEQVYETIRPNCVNLLQESSTKAAMYIPPCLADKIASSKQKRKEDSAAFWDSMQKLSNIGTKDKTARCPKCGSTSISYTNKKLSLGRAVVGDAVAGPAGAVLGGLSSKKGYAVCLKCGKQWKI